MTSSSTKGKTGIGRVSYPHVFQPQVDKKNGDKKSFSLVLLFDKNDPCLDQLKAAAAAAKDEKWPNKKPAKLKSPFRDGDELNDDGSRVKGPEYAGKVYVSFRAKEDRRPGVVGPDLQPITQQSNEFYSGCYARVSYSAYGYEVDGNAGVAFGLNNIQKVRDGERLDGRTDAEDDFDAIDSQSNKAMF